MTHDCYCDFERPEFYRKESRKAKKEHRCSECANTIHVGEEYEYAGGKWDGRLDTFKTCARCLALRDWVEAHIPCACWLHGNIREDAIEYARSYSHEAPGLLFGAYRREVMIRRNKVSVIT